MHVGIIRVKINIIGSPQQLLHPDELLERELPVGLLQRVALELGRLLYNGDQVFALGDLHAPGAVGRLCVQLAEEPHLEIWIALTAEFFAEAGHGGGAGEGLLGQLPRGKGVDPLGMRQQEIAQIVLALGQTGNGLQLL